MAAEPLIEMHGAAFAHAGGGFRLEIEALAIARGEITACVGASGCGKTTLLHLAAGITLPERGSVRLLGRELTGMSDGERRRVRRERVGVVFQEFELLAYLSAGENIGLGRFIGGVDGTGPRERGEALARAAGIDHLLRRKPARLSQGERQRVAVCRALAAAPEVVLCDEPTGNLDPATAEAVTEMLIEDARARGSGLLMVTHNHGLLGRFDRVLRVEADRAGWARVLERGP